MLVKTRSFSSGDLNTFRSLQSQSFSILEQMASELQKGVTEKEVARALVQRYRDAGFQSFFHLPVVLFGERTALPGDWSVGKFFPKKTTLKPGDPVILDAAPISDGFLVDTSYSFAFGQNSIHRKMMVDLSEFRDTILAQVNSGTKFKTIADGVVERFAEHGYEPAHGKHPGEVLGHRAVKLAKMPFDWRIQGFDGLSLSWFNLKDKLAQTAFGRRSPLWNGSAASNHKPHDGLWLVEPHAGKDGVGAKWEEIMVIDKGEAYWLEEAPPHVCQWDQISRGEDYAPSPQADRV